jgi:hypothetical protein
MTPNETSRQSAAASRALLVAAIAGILLIPSMFLSWFGPSDVAKARFPDRDLPAQTAWEAFSKLDAILALTAILGAGLALVIWAMARRRGVPGWPMLGGVLVGGIGTIGAVLLLGRMINPPGENDLQSVLLGAYVGLALTVALAAAGWTAAIVGLNAVRRGYVITMAPIVSTPASRQLGPGSAPGEAPARGQRLPR